MAVDLPDDSTPTRIIYSRAALRPFRIRLVEELPRHPDAQDWVWETAVTTRHVVDDRLRVESAGHWVSCGGWDRSRRREDHAARQGPAACCRTGPPRGCVCLFLAPSATLDAERAQ